MKINLKYIRVILKPSDTNLTFFYPRYQWNIDDQPVKIDKWDCNAVKNALDDAAKKVMRSCLSLLANFAYFQKF